MALVTPGWRRAFGLLVIALGLAHAVLPLRGWLQPNLFQNDAMPLMVLRNWGAFVLQPIGDRQTRFIVRTSIGQGSPSPWIAALDMMAFELPHFIMQRRMLQQIKALAEQRQG